MKIEIAKGSLFRRVVRILCTPFYDPYFCGFGEIISLIIASSSLPQPSAFRHLVLESG